MADDHGASPRELLMEACRRNNTSLLEEVLADLSAAGGEKATEHVAKTLNEARDGVGNGVLHLAATNGSCTYNPLPLSLQKMAKANPHLSLSALAISSEDSFKGKPPYHKSFRAMSHIPQPSPPSRPTYHSFAYHIHPHPLKPCAP